MKIVMICEFFNETLEFQENLLADYYVKNGHDVVLITSTFESVFDYYNDRHDPQAPSRTFQYNGFTVIKLKYAYNILNRLRAYTPIYGILEAEKPDLIYVHDIVPNISECVRYVKRCPSTKMIMDYHSDYSNSGKNQISIKILHGILRKWFLDVARPHLEVIYPVVPASETFLREVYGVPASEMEILPLGADLEYGDRVRLEGGGIQTRAELGIPPDAFVVFTGGKLTPNRKTEHLLEAVASMADPRLHVIVVGDGDEAYKARLREASRGLAAVRFVGWQDKVGMYRHLDASDVAVFPAAQSVIWQQAIGMRLPLILCERSELTGMHRQTVDYMNLNDNIIVMDWAPSLAPQIRAHLERLMDDPEELARRSEGARRTAADILDWNKIVARTLSHVQARAAA
jgi:1,2-diacylglycerol 3-alpha-glucosyltransferase